MMQFTIFFSSTLKLNKHLTRRSITNQIYRKKNYGKKLYLSQFNQQKLERVREFQFLLNERIFKLEFSHSQDEEKNVEKKNKSEYIVFGQ